MSLNIGLPNITGNTPPEQIKQIQSYLFQMAEQLNWALSTIETTTTEGTASTSNAIKFEQSEEITEKEAVDTFNSIKALIIKSADIVQAYEETIMTDFNGTYFADSDFGSYLKETNRVIEENSSFTQDVFNKVETITNTDGNGKLDNLESDVRDTEAYIKRGELGYHPRLKKDVYGIAVGQTDDDGIYNKYAWFIAEGLCLFDKNGVEVAYVNQNKLHITDAAFLGTVQFGKYQVDTSDGLAFTWVG